MGFSIHTLQEANAKRWQSAKLTRSSEYTNTPYAPVPRILAAQNRYERVQAMTGVSWVFVACTHYRESSLNFNTQLGQGDPLHSVSTHVPKGRGPFNTFEDGAYDALVNCAPHAAAIHDWSLPGMLTILEMYNGLGYAKRGLPSPYVWSGTDQYTSGKYVSDGVFNATVVDKQLGVAGLIMALAARGAIKAPEATQVAQTPINLPTASVGPTQPILNKVGEDIAPHLADLGHNIFEWLKTH